MSSTAPRNPMIMVAGRNAEGNSGVGTGAVATMNTGLPIA